MEIGSTLNNKPNIFKHAQTAIYVTNSDLKIFNSNFTEIGFDSYEADVVPPVLIRQGYGIAATNTTANAFNIVVDKNQLLNPNSFLNCNHAVYVKGRYNTTIANNNYDHCTTGNYCSYHDLATNNITIADNKFTQCINPIHCYNNPTSTNVHQEDQIPLLVSFPMLQHPFLPQTKQQRGACASSQAASFAHRGVEQWPKAIPAHEEAKLGSCRNDYSCSTYSEVREYPQGVVVPECQQFEKTFSPIRIRIDIAPLTKLVLASNALRSEIARLDATQTESIATNLTAGHGIPILEDLSPNSQYPTTQSDPQHD